MPTKNSFQRRLTQFQTIANKMFLDINTHTLQTTDIKTKDVFQILK